MYIHIQVYAYAIASRNVNKWHLGTTRCGVELDRVAPPTSFFFTRGAKVGVIGAMELSLL